MIELTDKLIEFVLLPFTWESILTYFPFCAIILSVIFAFITRLMGRW